MNINHIVVKVCKGQIKTLPLHHVSGDPMFRWLLPKSTDFFDFFEQHAVQAIEAAREFEVLITTAADIPAHAAKIQEIEHTADAIAHSCVEALHKTFITPFAREQIHTLISRLDDIVDWIEDAAAHLVLYRLTAMTAEIRDMAALLTEITTEVERALKNMRHLQNTEALRHSFNRIDALEHNADIVVRRALGRLFDEEHDVCMIVKWKEIYENLESAIDCCKSVANIIEGVILESV